VIIPKDIEEYIQKLKINYQSVKSIWLIGSRANEMAREGSDWDLLVFANKEMFNKLQNSKDFLNDIIDLYIVDEEGYFKNPYKDKAGDLSSWCWEQHSENEAIYRSTKFIPDEPGSNFGNFEEIWCKAIRVVSYTPVA